MGCITGIIAKTFLVAFNVAVAVSGIAVLTLASIVQSTLNGYGHDIPQEPLNVLIGLQSSATFVMCLGVLGVLVSCCCSNKLFLYTYFVLGVILVIMTLVFASMGAANINNEKYDKEIQENMIKDVNNYFSSNSSSKDSVDAIYQENKCCGSNSYTDYTSENAVPAGCCKDYQADKTCSLTDTNNIYLEGCHAKLIDDIGDISKATINFSIFFGVLLFALLTSTCLCVKCTDAMPI